MYINDEQKRQIMEELARGNPEMLIQKSSLSLLPAEQKLKKNVRRASENVMPISESQSHHAPETPENDGVFSEDTLKVLPQDIIHLIEERLVVNRSKRKIGEVIVRKEIETRIIQVPVRYEKLIVEQVSPERKQLVEINLGQVEGAGIELTKVTN